MKAPEYQAMDDARQWKIPEAFKKYTTDEFELKVLDPKRSSEPIPGPRPRPEFHIFDKNRKKVAQFYPNGYSECLDEKFRAIFDKMVKDIETAAQDAYNEFMRMTTGKPFPEKWEPHFPE